MGLLLARSPLSPKLSRLFTAFQEIEEDSQRAVLDIRIVKRKAGRPTGTDADRTSNLGAYHVTPLVGAPSPRRGWHDSGVPCLQPRRRIA